MNPIYFIAGYVVLTALFWLGNKNVPRKKPKNSAVKWLLWTTTWISLSIMLMQLPAREQTLDGILGPVLISPFVYPMLFGRDLPILTKLIIAVVPVAAAALGYVLAKKHNEGRGVVQKAPETRPVDYSDIGA